MNLESRLDAYKQGYHAHAQGLDFYDYEFEFNSPEWSAWVSGWFAANAEKPLDVEEYRLSLEIRLAA